MNWKSILSYPILSYPILSYPILSYPILSCPVLSCPVLPYLNLSYPFLSLFSFSILLYSILFHSILFYSPLPFHSPFCSVVSDTSNTSVSVTAASNRQHYAGWTIRPDVHQHQGHRQQKSVPFETGNRIESRKGEIKKNRRAKCSTDTLINLL